MTKKTPDVNKRAMRTSRLNEKETYASESAQRSQDTGWNPTGTETNL